MSHNTELGRRGEHLAAEHLEAAGMTIVDRNWRCALGEVDLVARTGATLVFVEVKTRSGEGFGHPFESITPRKLARLRRLAAAWCDETGSHADLIRIDAISVLAPPAGAVLVEHLEGIC